MDDKYKLLRIRKDTFDAIKRTKSEISNINDTMEPSSFKNGEISKKLRDLDSLLCTVEFNNEHVYKKNSECDKL